jgi:2,3-bisphosphoglycerate-independent phosphoglycerate mutase
MLSLLGYPEVALRAKRGSLEASVVFGGMSFGCLYARGNLSSLVNGKVPSRRVNRDVLQAEADAICEMLNSAVPAIAGRPCRFRSYSTYRLAVEIFLGADVVDSISGTDPGYADDEFGAPAQQADFEPVLARPADGSCASRAAAEAVNEITRACHAILDGSALNTARRSLGRLPINHILMRDFGTSLPSTDTFWTRWGCRAKYFHDLPVELGVANYLEMDQEEAGCASVTEGAFADAGRRLIRDFQRYDFISFHVKGPDEPGHDGDWNGKVRAIEAVDAGLFSLLAREVEAERVRLAITSDHATCWGAGTHTADDVPLIVTSRGWRDLSLRLTEEHCQRRTLSTAYAWDLMPVLLQK